MEIAPNDAVLAPRSLDVITPGQNYPVFAGVQLVSRRYEKGSILITSNRSVGEWGGVFGDPVVATAILDRLLHHSTVTRLDKAAQVFILTHNLQCMGEFRKAWKNRVRPLPNKEPTATFLFIDVTIPEGQPRRSSTIVEMSKLLREYDSEYHFLFSHVLRFSEKPDAYDDHGYMIPNVMRRVLDVFLAFKAPGSGGLPSQLDKLCTDYPELNRDRLAGLERLAQVESHSDNVDDLLSFSSMTLEETRGAVAVLFEMMERVDAKHFERLKSLCR